MKKVLFLIGLFGILALMVAPISAETLYQQEGTTDDGTPSIDASGHGPTNNPNTRNWKYQYGSGGWRGVYAGDDGWLESELTEWGDSSLEVEADIEMYCEETIAKNKIYFHLGNIYSATSDNKTAYVTGTMVSNNGQYVGISFDGTNKTEASFEKVGGSFTGVILGGMVSKRDSWRVQDNSMDLRILLSWGSGYQVPVNFGEGSHGTQQNVLWWLPGGGAAGSYNLTWQVKLLPVPHQPDGDYYLDPVLTTSPVM